MTTTWKLVPVEATDEMYRAALGITRDPGYGHIHDATGGAVYRAMLSAARDPLADEALVERVAAAIADANYYLWDEISNPALRDIYRRQARAVLAALKGGGDA